MLFIGYIKYFHVQLNQSKVIWMFPEKNHDLFLKFQLRSQFIDYLLKFPITSPDELDQVGEVLRALLMSPQETTLNSLVSLAFHVPV